MFRLTLTLCHVWIWLTFQRYPAIASSPADDTNTIAIQTSTFNFSRWITFGGQKQIRFMTDFGTTNHKSASAICAMHGLDVSLIQLKSHEEAKRFKSTFITSLNLPPMSHMTFAFWLHPDSGSVEDNSKLAGGLEGSNESSSTKCFALTFPNDFADTIIWASLPCTQHLWIACQRPWNDTPIAEEVTALKQRQLELEKRFEMLEKRPMQPPVGFIYTQLPGQLEPSDLWKLCEQCRWEDISKTYEGNFFRVVGGAAAEFGAIQGSQTRMLNVRTGYTGTGEGNPVSTPVNGGWSPPIWSGQNGGPKNLFLAFQMPEVEIRPRNQAVRIWKRIG